MARKSSSIDGAYRAANKCLDAIQELVNLLNSGKRIILGLLEKKEGRSLDGSLEPFRAADKRLKETAAALNSAFPGASKARTSRGPCTRCRLSAQDCP